MAQKDIDGPFDVLYRSPVSRMWDAIGLLTERGNSVTTDLLRQRHDVLREPEAVLWPHGGLHRGP